MLSHLVLFPLTLTINIRYMKIKKLILSFLPVLAIGGLIVFNACINADKNDANNAASDITVPAGFSAVTIAENLGAPRHMVVTPQNDIYVHLAGVKNGKGILVLHEDGGKAAIKSG